MLRFSPPARLSALVLLAGLALAPGCGPTLYTIDVFSASRTVERAAAAEAADRAPYEYYSARAYLEKAREEASEGHYQDALHYAHTAADFGNQALERSRQAQGEER